MIDLDILDQVFQNMAGRVRYDLGAKAPNLSADTSKIKVLDCSGFCRYALYRASHGLMKLPDGSYIQHEWVRKQGWRRLERYSDVAYASLDTSRLFIGFISPSPHGHVWLVRAGVTLESHGGVGVDSRPWNSSVLVRNVDDTYEVPLG